MSSLTAVLSAGCRDWNVDIQPEQKTMFERYAELLVEWNARINLTTILEPQEIAIKHFVDSIALLKYCSISTGQRVVDIGTGAGLPGLPLKILRPDLIILLVDALQKRVQFLNAVVKHLDLKDVTIIHGRAEDLGQDAQYREQYDVVVSRAVAPLNVLLEFSLPLVRIGGIFAALKGPDVNEEIQAAGSAIVMLGGESRPTVINYCLPILNDARSMVIFNKANHSPAKYPRRPGLPDKRPL